MHRSARSRHSACSLSASNQASCSASRCWRFHLRCSLGTPRETLETVVSDPETWAPIDNLPIPPTPFLGRQAELQEIATRLANPNCRLLTLLGPGGIGKTRLAIQAASDQRAHFQHGVCFVSLASLRSGQPILPSHPRCPGSAHQQR